MRRESGHSRNSSAKTATLVALGAICLWAMATAPVDAVSPGASSSALPLETMGVVLIGLAIGCYGTVVGIGGGPLIMPVLISLYGWKTETLVGTCLLVVLLNAASGSVGYLTERRVDVRGAVKLSVAAVPGTILAGFLHHWFDFKAFSIVFGLFLLTLALYSCLTIDQIDDRPRKGRPNRRPHTRRVRLIDRTRQRFEFYTDDNLGMKANLGLGLFSGFMGTGGGVLQVPLLHYVLHYPPHIATATSHFITMITCATAFTPHMLLGNVHYDVGLWMGAGAVVGAQVGARVARQISSRAVMALFILVLFGFAAELLFG